MRGASRVSLAEARQRLSEAVTSAAEARTLGDELFAILELLDAQPGVRRALTDSSRPAEARSGLARTLLGGRVSDATLDLFTSMCASRWSAPRGPGRRGRAARGAGHLGRGRAWPAPR